MKLKFAFFLVLLSSSVLGQKSIYPLNHSYSNIIEKQMQSKSANYHTAMRPFIFEEKDSTIIDSAFAQFKRSKKLYLLGVSWWSKAALWGERKIFDEPFITLKKDELTLRLHPLCDFGYGRDSVSKKVTYSNSRGVWVEGTFGKKIYFSTSFIESQADFLPYVDAQMTNSLVVPGQGRYKIFKNNQGYDYNRSSALISYSPNKTFNFQFGQDKLFIGDGYRSLLLSDNSFNYPFVKVSAKFWKVQYSSIYAQLTSAVTANDQLFPKKYGTFHYLSWNATKWLNIGLFESIIWSGANGRGFDFQYLNPIIFLRPVEFNNGSSDNALLGATGKIKITNKWHLYGQLLVDEFNFQKVKQASGWWGNKWGIQAGTKCYDLFKIKNLSTQLEFNAVRPYTYSHSDSLSNYSHFNQALAHPLGANFMEGVGFIRYNHKRIFLEIKGSWAQYGADINGVNWGGNIFLSYNTNKAQIPGAEPEFGHQIGQGLVNTLWYSDVKVAYLVNPNNNMRFEMGWMKRDQRTYNTVALTNYFYIGLKTALFNYYTDF